MTSARAVWVAALCALATPSAAQTWEFGAFVDLGHLQSFHSPSNHLFRSRGTTPRVDELNINMAGVYARKKASAASRWGFEVTGHGGEDSQLFGFSATAPNLRGAEALRRLGPTNVSYLAPAGGVALQAGIFTSFIGYDSLYAKDNFTYTRPWSADFTPYLMLGVNATVAATERVSVSALVVNGYWHLAHANGVPSVGGQLAFKATPRVTVKQTAMYGPHQPDTSLGRWRVLSDTIVERKGDRLTGAVEFQFGTETIDEARRAVWLAVQVPLHWHVTGPWSATTRPELARDRSGRWTAFAQTVAAITSTLEHRRRFGPANTILRLEHRYDRSTGRDGGFFRDTHPGQVGLTPGQHLLALAVLLHAARQ